MKSEGDNIKEILQASYIPNAAMYTTLQKMDLLEIRKYIENDALVLFADRDQGIYGAPGLFIFSNKNYRKARLALGTAAKEMVLVGNQGVAYITLTKLVDMMDNYESYSDVTFARYLFIADFYHHGTESPLTGRQQSRLQSRLLEWIGEGISISVCSDIRVQDMDWYSRAFRNSVEEYFIACEVK